MVSLHSLSRRSRNSRVAGGGLIGRGGNGSILRISSPSSDCGKDSTQSSKQGTDLTRIVIQVIIQITLDSNQETQRVIKGTVKALNVCANLPNMVGEETSLHSRVDPVGLLWHINLERERELERTHNTKPKETCLQ